MVTMQLSGDVAVVGLAYKLPRDIEDDAAFWEVLQGAKNLSSEWPESRSRETRRLLFLLHCCVSWHWLTDHPS